MSPKTAIACLATVTLVSRTALMPTGACAGRCLTGKSRANAANSQLLSQTAAPGRNGFQSPLANLARPAAPLPATAVDSS